MPGNHAGMKFPMFAIVFAAIAFGSLGCSGSGAGGGGGVNVNVSLTNMTFSPQLVTAHAGETVVWTNNEAMLHTVTSDTSEPGLDSFAQYPGGMSQGNTFAWVVPANAVIGTHYFYHCNFHGTAGNGAALGTGMTGEITVN
jgi:plastocyanin